MVSRLSLDLTDDICPSLGVGLTLAVVEEVGSGSSTLPSTPSGMLVQACLESPSAFPLRLPARCWTEKSYSWRAKVHLVLLPPLSFTESRNFKQLWSVITVNGTPVQKMEKCLMPSEILGLQWRSLPLWVRVFGENRQWGGPPPRHPAG